MSPRKLSEPLVREAPAIGVDEKVETAVSRILESGLPALPVVRETGELCGIFGEREFMEALFPGYVGQLHYAGFVSKKLDEALQKRAGCRREPVSNHMNTEHVEVPTDYSDVQVAEIFLHHRVLIVPVCEQGGRVTGVITRSDFFRRLAERFLETPENSSPPA